MKWVLGLCMLILLAGCRQAGSPAWAPEVSPAGPNSEAPAFHVGPQGIVYLSWVEWVDDTTSSLRFSVREADRWSPPREIARGADWFVNWADRPGLTAFPDGKHLAAHWLRKSAPGKYDYHVMISISADGGRSWNSPFPLHDDGIAAEHGFVSASRDGDRLFYAWLDGRRTIKEGASQGLHGHDHHGAMTLRGAWLDTTGKKSGEAELDSMVCDCCQTDVTTTSRGLLIVYRDRTPEETRDIAHIRWDGSQWTSPGVVAPDGWHIAGCPVNGPAVLARGDSICRIWFGTRDSIAHVSAIWSLDGGITWQDPVLLDGNNPIGRVDVTPWEAGFLVTWIGQDARDSTGLLAVVLNPGEKPAEPMKIASMDPGRGSGFPVIVSGSHSVFAAYTSMEGNASRVLVLKMVSK